MEWNTQSENCKHAWDNGLQKVTEKRIECGKRYAKLNFDAEKKRKRVCQYDIQGGFIKEWESISEAGVQTDINFRNISACCNGKRKTAGNYIWRYADTQ